MTAVLPSPRTPKVASTFISGSGPVTRRVSNRPDVAVTNAGTVPSPPSATGQASISTPGSTSRNPAAIASQISPAVRQPLNLSGARTTFMRPVSYPCPGPTRRLHWGETQRELPNGIHASDRTGRGGLQPARDGRQEVLAQELHQR